MKTILNIRRISTNLAAAAAVVGLLLSAALAGAGPALLHASGGGSFEASGGSGDNEYMFAFNARQLNDKFDAKGQLEYHNLTNGHSLHIKISRLFFLGDATVGLMGEVTKSVGESGNSPIGQCRALKLQDNGEGKNALELDQTSKLSSACDFLTAKWDTNAFGLIPLDRGNVQIR